jgi:hypothetical protein
MKDEKNEKKITGEIRERVNPRVMSGLRVPTREPATRVNP